MSQWSQWRRTVTFTPGSSTSRTSRIRVPASSLTPAFRHCVGPSGQDGPRNCERTDRDYNIPLRVGLLFAILATSALGKSRQPSSRTGSRATLTWRLEYKGVFGPIFISHYLPSSATSTLVILKQFGTGVIISTSLVHVRAYLPTRLCLSGNHIPRKQSARPLTNLTRAASHPRTAHVWK